MNIITSLHDSEAYERLTLDSFISAGHTAYYNPIHFSGYQASYVAMVIPTYLKPINTHPTLGEGQNGKLYGSGPDPFPPPRNKRERVGYARLGRGGVCQPLYGGQDAPPTIIRFRATQLLLRFLPVTPPPPS